MASVALAFDILARDKASRTFKQVGDSADNVSGRVTRLGGAFANFGKVAAIGLGAAAVGAVALGKSFVDAAVESQKVTKQTEAVIKSMGGASNVTAKQVADLSEKLSMQSGVDDELIQSSQNVLLTFGKVQNKVGKGNKIFDRATEAALNMSVALGTDMQGASIQVGKALNDPIKGLTALGRAGVSFSKKQQDQIKWMTKSGNVLGAQKIILDELERQFGGSAKAQATAGDRLRVIWGNLQEDLGEKLLPIFEAVATWLSRYLPAALETVGRFIQPVIDQIGAFWNTLSTGFTEDEGTPIERFALLIRDTVAPAIKGFVDGALKALSNWWNTNGDNVLNFFEDIGSAVKDNIVPFFGSLASIIKDEVLPRLSDFAGWIGRNKIVFDTLRLAIIGLATAWGIYTVATGAAAIATGVAILPYAAAAVALAGLVVVTARLINQFKGPLLEAFARFQQVGSGILDFFQTLKDRIVFVINKVKELIDLLPSVPGFGGDGGGGFDWTDLLPGNVNPNGGIPFVPFLDDGGVMPGRRGVHYPALVAGGETVLPTHKTGVPFDAVGEDQLVELRRQNSILASIDNRLRTSGGVASWRASAAVM